MDAAVGCAKVIVKSGVDPGLKILPSPFRINVRRPGDGQRMHAVFVFQHVGGVEAVFAAGSGNQAVIRTVLAAETVAEFNEFFFPLAPGNVRLQLDDPAGITNPFIIKLNRLFL